MKTNKRITIKDIASKANASLSMVNKALYSKPGISEQRKREIVEIAEQLGYKVNKVAQSLARKPLRIGVLIPEYWPQFHSYLEKGIHTELDLLHDYNVYGIFRRIPAKKSQEEIITITDNIIINEKIDALILCPGFYYDYSYIFKKADKADVPIILLGNDLPYGKRLTFVGVDSDLSGRMVAEAARFLIRNDGSAAIFIGNKNIESHNKKVEGFLEELRSGPFKFADVYETSDDPELAYNITKKLINDFPDIEVIYVATGNSIAVCRYINENDLKIKVISTDISTQLVKYMNMGIIALTIFQDPLSQGREAVRAIYSFLTEQKHLPDKILISPLIVLKSNIKLYL